MTDIVSADKTGTGSHLAFDLAEAREKFGKAPFRVGHDLAEHPLFQLDALVELAERLPVEHIEHNAGNKDVVVADNDSIAVAPTTAAELLRQIEHRPGFVALPTTVPGVPRQPGYQELFEEILDELAPMIDGGRAASSDHHAVIFVASGGNTTPSHVDPEPSFLLHVRGVKRFSIGRYPDADTEQRDLEAFYAHEGRNTPVAPVDVEHYDLAPGESLHVPPVKPHWVENGPEVAISFSVGFKTTHDHHRAGVYQFNHRARKLGLSPKPYGAHAGRDRAKGAAMYSVFRARNAVLRRPR